MSLLDDIAQEVNSIALRSLPNDTAEQFGLHIQNGHTISELLDELIEMEEGIEPILNHSYADTYETLDNFFV